MAELMADSVDGFQFCASYSHDVAKFRAFNDFTDRVFSFDFIDWTERGFWDCRYVPFSYFSGDKVVSNVSVYSLDMVIEGVPRRAAQICTCATLAEYRGRGLATRLLKAVVDQARHSHDFVFLLATDEVTPLYRANGFTPVTEHVARLKGPRLQARAGLLKLAADNPDDLGLIARLAEKRAPVSDRCGVRNTRLLMFHCLHPLRDCLYYIPDLGCVVLFARRGRKMRIYDVIGETVPPFARLYPYLTDGRREAVEFMFLPDKMGVSGLKWRRTRANNLHVWGAHPFGRKNVLIPFTAQA